MMERKDGQIQIVVIDLKELTPENHLPKKIDGCVSFS